MLHENESEYVNAILDSPAAPLLVARLQSLLEAERARRAHFYQEIDDDMKAEFVNGEVVIHSPVKKEHTEATGFLYKLLDTFVRLKGLGFVGYEKVLIALTRNDYEPDVVFFGPEKSAGFKKGQWKFPPPDFVVEVLSETTEARDRGVKFEDYAAHGVGEYWIIDPDAESVEQYILQEGQYRLFEKLKHGTIDSQAVPGFTIDVRAVFDENANLEALRRLMTPA